MSIQSRSLAKLLPYYIQYHYALILCTHESASEMLLDYHNGASLEMLTSYPGCSWLGSVSVMPGCVPFPCQCCHGAQLRCFLHDLSSGFCFTVNSPYIMI